MKLYRIIVIVVALSLGLLSVAYAQNKPFDFERDVEQELQRPNVKLVVVILTAEWCEPCKKEKPIWKRLRRLYGGQGVRFVVIRFNDADNKMKLYRWAHREFWDDEGRWGKAFGIGDTIPAAFLWSWQGKLLQKNAKVLEVKQAIEGFLGDNPRVVVKARGKRKQPDAALRDAVERELLRQGKFDVLSNAQDRAMMEKEAEASHGLERDEKQRCALGRKMSPNMILKASYRQGTLDLRLKSIETQCDVQFGRADINSRKQLLGAVKYAVKDLLANLREPRIELPVVVTWDRSPPILEDLTFDFRQGLWATPQSIVRRYKQACRAGDSLACEYERWHRGAAIPDFGRARQIFGKACKKGNLTACVVHGWALSQNEQKPGKADTKVSTVGQAVAAFHKACEGAHLRGCVELGRLYRRGVGVAKDVDRAVALYQKACKGGNMRGCSSLGFIHAKGHGVGKDQRKANEYYQKACDGGNEKGCYNLGYRHKKGNGVAKDMQKANPFFQKACQGGHMKSCFFLGANYLDGKGVSQNQRKAKQLYQKACTGKYQKACERLKAL